MLGQDEDRHHALLVQVGEEFVNLEGDELLLRHSIEVPGEAVDHDDPRSGLLDCISNMRHKLTGREMGWVNLFDP